MGKGPKGMGRETKGETGMKKVTPEEITDPTRLCLVAMDAEFIHHARKIHDLTYGAGLRLKMSRTQTGLSLRRLAKLSGMSPAYLSDLEKGKRRITTKTLARIGEALASYLNGLGEE